MSGYNREKKTFMLTVTKMEYYHRHHTHTTFPREICPICNAQYGQEYMQMVAAFLTANGFDVVDIADAHIAISAPSKPRKKFGMWITKETDALYQLLAGRTEPQPGSLPQDGNLFNIAGIEHFQDDELASSQENTPIMYLHVWLADLKKQKHLALQQEKSRIQQSAPLTENTDNTGEHENRTIITCQAELAFIERIQTKIQELLEDIGVL